MLYESLVETSLTVHRQFHKPNIMKEKPSAQRTSVFLTYENWKLNKCQGQCVHESFEESLEVCRKPSRSGNHKQKSEFYQHEALGNVENRGTYLRQSWESPESFRNIRPKCLWIFCGNENMKKHTNDKQVRSHFL